MKGTDDGGNEGYEKKTTGVLVVEDQDLIAQMLAASEGWEYEDGTPVPGYAVYAPDGETIPTADGQQTRPEFMLNQYNSPYYLLGFRPFE
ncbi:MAG: hypothetical protein IJQ12_10155 [Lachnospiraceae bacterium]|nr:hypothetical protein [Lachnospiraceae bacterium]